MSADSSFQSILARCGLSVSNPSVVASDFQSEQIRELMNEAGKEAVKRVDWSELMRRMTFTGQAVLPEDFERAKSVKLTGGGRVRNTPSAEMWDFMKTQGSTLPYYHLEAGNIECLSPNEAELLYVSANWVTSKAAIDSGADEFSIPERVVEMGTVWRWHRQKGLPYQDLMDEYEAMLVQYEMGSKG